eukprot:362065-Amphidinium_carterae.1
MLGLDFLAAGARAAPTSTDATLLIDDPDDEDSCIGTAASCPSIVFKLAVRGQATEHPLPRLLLPEVMQVSQGLSSGQLKLAITT